MQVNKAALDKITKELVDQGKLIEAGWASLRIMAVAPGAPQVQIDEMRNAFFAGAQHLFASIMSVLEEGEKPTASDLNRLSSISKELDEFIAQYKLKHMSAKGTG